MEGLTFGDSLGDSLEYIKNNTTSMIPYNMQEEIMTISDYNKIARFYGMKNIH